MSNQPRSFTVASYNVLADAFITPGWYPFVEPDVLRATYRHAALVEHVAHVNADVICMQEVELPVYEMLVRRLHPLGYSSLRAQRPNGRVDGCAMFVRERVFTALSFSVLPFHDGSGNVALIATMEHAGMRVGIATVHLAWERNLAPHEPRRALSQVRSIVATFQKEQPGLDASIICGDFNALPDDDVPTELARAGYTDAYGQLPAAHTCNVNAEAKRIDYLFSSRALDVHPVALRPIDDHTPLPSRAEPSDHLLIAATYSWRQGDYRLRRAPTNGLDPDHPLPPHSFDE